MAVFSDLDVAFEALTDAPQVDAAEAGQSPSFVQAIEDLNRRLSRLTGTSIELKKILPLTLLGCELWSISRRGLMVEVVPGWLFLSLALDTFVKLHPHRN